MFHQSQTASQSSVYSNPIIAQSAVPCRQQSITPADVILPHQQLLGCMPVLSDETKAELSANAFMVDGDCFDIVDNWSIWKPMFRGCERHGLYNTDLLTRIMDAPLRSNAQAVMLSTMALAVEGQLHTIIEEFSNTIHQTALENNLALNETLKAYQASNFAYDISFESSINSQYGSYESKGLNMIDGSGLSVIDINLSEHPLALRQLTHALIYTLSVTGLFNWSGELIEVVLGAAGNETADKIKSHLNSYDLSVVGTNIDNMSQEEFAVFLRDEYADFYDEITDDDPDFDWSYYQLQDALNYNLSFDENNPYIKFVDFSDVPASINAINDVLIGFERDSDPIAALPFFTVLQGVITTFKTLLGTHNNNVFEVNSDEYLPQTRIVSVDIENDSQLLECLSSRLCEAGESAAFTIDLSEEHAIDTLKNVVLSQIMIGYLAS
tara:strand:- start:1358 stop:2674 length:1317 start_codon:yes stop_codon:yes gene_type:complete